MAACDGEPKWQRGDYIICLSMPLVILIFSCYTKRTVAVPQDLTQISHLSDIRLICEQL